MKRKKDRGAKIYKTVKLWGLKDSGRRGGGAYREREREREKRMRGERADLQANRHLILSLSSDNTGSLGAESCASVCP